MSLGYVKGKICFIRLSNKNEKFQIILFQFQIVATTDNPLFYFQLWKGGRVDRSHLVGDGDQDEKLWDGAGWRELNPG